MHDGKNLTAARGFGPFYPSTFDAWKAAGTARVPAETTPEHELEHS